MKNQNTNLKSGLGFPAYAQLGPITVHSKVLRWFGACLVAVGAASLEAAGLVEGASWGVIKLYRQYPEEMKTLTEAILKQSQND